MDVTLLRIIDSLERPTKGILFLGGDPLWTTLEPPNKHNIPKISCIPEGVYICRRQSDVTIGHKEPKVYSKLWQVMDVAGRSGIYFHEGNFKEDTEGCILVGIGFNSVGVTQSKLGLSSFMNELHPPKGRFQHTFTLTVRFAR